MIHLTRINHEPVVINADLIEHIESTPDTIICLTTRQTIMVLETVEEVIDRIVEFRRRIVAASSPGCSGVRDGGRAEAKNQD